MSIQPSVLIWTIICLLRLMLVLSKLLFKPLLAFMDARREKIERARAAREEALRRKAELESSAVTARQDAEKRAAQTAAAMLEDAHARCRNEAETLLHAQEDALEEEKKALAAESEAIIASLEPRLDAVAGAFADKLLL